MNTPSKGFRHLVAAAISSAFATGLASACVAADGADALQVTVNYSDLDVTNPHGAAVLYSRLHDAAYAVCQPLDLPTSTAQMRLHVCIRKAIAQAVIKVDVPAVSAVYRARNGEPPKEDLIVSQLR